MGHQALGKGSTDRMYVLSQSSRRAFLSRGVGVRECFTRSAITVRLAKLYMCYTGNCQQLLRMPPGLECVHAPSCIMSVSFEAVPTSCRELQPWRTDPTKLQGGLCWDIGHTRIGDNCLFFLGPSASGIFAASVEIHK